MGPRIITRRLLLRSLVEGDRAAIAKLFAAPAVRRHLALAGLKNRAAPDLATRFIRGAQDEWREGGCGALAMALQVGDGPVIGYCGLRLLPDRISAVELLYALGPDHWGQGLATEAAGAMLQWGFANLAVDEILAFCRPGHAASRRVLEKLGLADRGLTDRYYGETLAIYGLARPA